MGGPPAHGPGRRLTPRCRHNGEPSSASSAPAVEVEVFDEPLPAIRRWSNVDAVDWAPGRVAAAAEAFHLDLLAAIRAAISIDADVRTLSDGQPNLVRDVMPDGVWVETERSRWLGRPAQLVEAWMIQVAYDRLRAHGTLTNRFLDTDGLNVKRSSFVCALLARLAGVEVGSTRPIVLVMVTTTVFGSTTQQGLETAEARGLTVRVLNPSRGTFHHQALCRPARRAARVRRRLGQPHKPPGRQRRGRRRPHRAARRASARAAVGAGRVVSADRTSRADRTPARRRDARGGPSSHGTPPPRARRAGRGRAATARPSAPSPAARRARSRRGRWRARRADDG